MGDDKTLKGPQDRNRISLSEDYEVRYWCEKFGVTEKEFGRGCDEGRQLGESG
jgi:Protein of unknown function (DUF3606)